MTEKTERFVRLAAKGEARQSGLETKKPRRGAGAGADDAEPAGGD